MKTNKIDSHYLMFGFIFVFLLFSLIVSSFALAINKVNVVLFYTNWDARSRELKPNLEQIVGSYSNVSLTELNVDLPVTADQARALGLTMPRTVPEIVILNKNGSPVFEKTYGRVSPKQLKTELDQVLIKQ